MKYQEKYIKLLKEYHKLHKELSSITYEILKDEVLDGCCVCHSAMIANIEKSSSRIEEIDQKVRNILRVKV